MAMKRINFRGVTVSQRTADMVLEAERLCKFTLSPTQGSYNRGGVSASAGTHDGGGAVDIRARTLTTAQKAAAVVALRRVGFAAWLRRPSEGPWVEHIHAIAMGDVEASRGAKNQMTAYKNGRNGLANNGRDNATRAYVNVTWEKYVAAKKAAANTVAASKVDWLGNPLYGKGPYAGRWTRGPVPRHPLYVSTLYFAIGSELGERKETLDAWEKAHVKKVCATLAALVRQKGKTPHQSIVNLTKQVQTLWLGIKYGDKTYGRFDRSLVNLLAKRAGYTFWDGPRHDNGIK